MIYASVRICSSVQSHNSFPPAAKNKEGDFWEVMPCDKVKWLASIMLVLSFKSSQSPVYKCPPPLPGHSFTLPLSFLVLVLWLCSRLSCFSPALIGTFMRTVFIFLHSPRGKRMTNPIPGDCPTQDSNKRREVDRPWMGQRELVAGFVRLGEILQLLLNQAKCQVVLSGLRQALTRKLLLLPPQITMMDNDGCFPTYFFCFLILFLWVIVVMQL